MTYRSDDHITPRTWLGIQARRHPVLAAFTVALLVMVLPVYGLYHEATTRSDAIEKQSRLIQEQRAEAIGLVCDINRVLREFIQAEPDYPRDEQAIEDLKKERCDDLLADIRGARQGVTEKRVKRGQ